MLSGISGSGGYAPRFITSVRVLPPTPRAEVAPTDAASQEPAEVSQDLTAPAGNQDELTHEFTMLDLASRQFARILPEIEMVNAPVE